MDLELKGNKMKEKMYKVIAFVEEKHKGQLDDLGLPYVLHCFTVANILRNVSNDEDVIIAGYLHDTIEDTNTTYDELVENFGKRVADLVMEVTHEGKKDEIGFYFPRLKTREGIMIKFADRLDNLSRMQNWTEERKAHYLKRSKFWKSEQR